jgi:hypothetical protein
MSVSELRCSEANKPENSVPSRDYPRNGGNFLAYKLELQRLPCLRRKAKARKPKDISRARENGGKADLSGRAAEVNQRASAGKHL